MAQVLHMAALGCCKGLHGAGGRGLNLAQQDAPHGDTHPRTFSLLRANTGGVTIPLLTLYYS